MNRDIWGIYEEIRVPFTSPTWNFWGAYSFEVDFAEREEWYSTQHLYSAVFRALPGQYRRCIPSIMHRSRRYLFAGNR